MPLAPHITYFVSDGYEKMKNRAAVTRQLGNLKLRNEVAAVKEYKYQGETFQLDDSKGCYVAVTYKHLTGYVGVRLGLLGKKATDQEPYGWLTDSKQVTSEGLKFGNVNGPSFEANLDALCAALLSEFRAEEAAKAFDPEKYCAELHAAVMRGQRDGE